MNDLISLDALADAINHEHTEVERALTAAVGHAIKAGELLLQAKANVAHGEWLPWMKAHCRVSERTAQAYMRLAREVTILGGPGMLEKEPRCEVVYFLHSQPHGIKIGKADDRLHVINQSNLSRRISGHRTSNPGIEVLGVTAAYTEKQIHDKFSTYQNQANGRKNEWFVDTSVIREFVNKWCIPLSTWEAAGKDEKLTVIKQWAESKSATVADLPLREALQALAEPKEPEPKSEKCPGGWLDATPEARRNAMLTWPQDRMQYTLLLEAYGHSPGEIAEILNIDEGLITPILNPEPPDRYLGGFDFGDAQGEFEKGYRLAVKSQISGMLAVSYKDASFHAKLDGRNDVYSMLSLLAKRNRRHSQEYLDTAYGVLGCFQEEWIYVFFMICAVTDARIALGIDRTETGREALWMMLARYEKDAKQAVKMSRKHT